MKLHTEVWEGNNSTVPTVPAIREIETCNEVKKRNQEHQTLISSSSSGRVWGGFLLTKLTNSLSH